MDAEKLHAVAQGVLEEWDSQDLPNALTRVGDTLEQAVNQPNEQTAAAFKAARDDLFESLGSSRVPDLVPSYARILRAIGAERWSGPGLRASVESLLSRESLVPGAALNELRALTQEFQEYRARIEEMLRTFSHIELPSDELPDERFELGFLLPDRSDRSLGRLEEDLDQLTRHLRTLAEVVGGSDAELEVNALSRGSWEIYILASLGLADLTTRIIERLVNIYQSALQIKESRERLREHDVPEEALAGVQNFESKRTDALLAELRDELLEDFEGTKTRKNELKKGLLDALRFFAALVDEGGLIEVRSGLSTSEDDADVDMETEELSESELRVIEGGSVMSSLSDVRQRLLLPGADEQEGEGAAEVEEEGDPDG